MKPTRHSRYSCHRFPAEVISHAVWLYFRFPLSLRMVEEMLAARGIEVSHETVRQWALKFGQSFANQIRRRLPAPTNGTSTVCHEHISEGGDVELYKR
jgi:putative transposase